MTPLFAIANPRDARRRDAVFTGEFNPFDTVCCTDLSRLVISQFCTSILVARMTGSAPLLISISHVIKVGSQPKMLGSATCPYVTMMKHMQSVRNIPMRKLPRKSVGLIAGITKREDTVTGIVDASAPQPARFCLFNLLPKVRLCGYPKPTTSKSARDTAKLLGARRVCSEFCATNRAYAGRLRAILGRHRSLSLRCRAGGVRSTARLPDFPHYTTKTTRRHS